MLEQSRRRWLLRSLASLLAGCAVVVAAQVQPEPGGTLFILNDSGRTLIAGNQALTDNGRPLASLPRLSWTQVQLAPGRHVLRTDPFLWKQEVELTVQPGQRYYVVVAYRPERSWALPFAGTPLLLKPLAEADAQALMREMQPLR